MATTARLIEVGCRAGGIQASDMAGRSQPRPYIRGSVCVVLYRVMKYSHPYVAALLGFAWHDLSIYNNAVHDKRYQKSAVYREIYTAVFDECLKISGVYGTDINVWDCIIAINRLVYPVRKEFL